MNETKFIIRQAKPDDASELTRLTKKSKAHWGYESSLLDKWEKELTITSDFIKNSASVVAEIKGKIIGFWCRELTESNDITSGYLFVDPEHMGTGCASALFNVLKQELSNKGIMNFTLEADPNAEGFKNVASGFMLAIRSLVVNLAWQPDTPFIIG